MKKKSMQPNFKHQNIWMYVTCKNTLVTCKQVRFSKLNFLMIQTYNERTFLSCKIEKLIFQDMFYFMITFFLTLNQVAISWKQLPPLRLMYLFPALNALKTSQKKISLYQWKHELDYHFTLAIMYYDNQFALHLAANPIYYKLSKHIKINCELHHVV